MDRAKREALEAAGFVVGDVEDLLAEWVETLRQIEARVKRLEERVDTRAELRLAGYVVPAALRATRADYED